MFIDITEVNFNKTKEIWENNGIKTYDVSLNKKLYVLMGLSF